jgi:two-component system LytT family response regulator
MNFKNTYSILIVDHEAAGRGVIQKLLVDILPIPYIVQEASSVNEALAILQSSTVDLLFLDVQMPEQNGFDLLKQLPLITFEIIFVTDYDKYAIHAFRFNAIDYLLKPVDMEELKWAVKKALAKKSNGNHTPTSFAYLLSEKKVAVHINDKVVFIYASDISYITAADNYSEIITTDKRRFTTPRLLKEFEVYFKNLPFVRISRSTIINALVIKSYTKDFPCIIELLSGEKFEVSRRKKAEALKQLEVI